MIAFQRRLTMMKRKNRGSKLLIMSAFDFDNNSESDWDSSEELGWNEFQWQKYLKKNQDTIATFLGHYEELKRQPGHLDEIAHRMRWDNEDWAPGDPDEEEDDSPFASQESEGSFAESEEDFEPYTVHKHPVYIVTHGLYQHLIYCWEQFCSHAGPAGMPALFASRFATSLHQGEFHAAMAINALDMGDFNLAVCHFKCALSGINQSMALINQLEHAPEQLITAFKTEALQALFDLRDVWLRVMSDCREEEKRRR